MTLSLLDKKQMSEQLSQQQNSPASKKLEIVEEEEEEMETTGANGADKSTEEEDGEGADDQAEAQQRQQGQQEEDGHSSEAHPNVVDLAFSMEVEVTDEGGQQVVGGTRSERDTEEQQPKGEDRDGAGGRQRSSVAPIETPQIGTQKSDSAQPSREKGPSKLRIHRVFRNEAGVEVRQCETVADPRLVEQYLKMRMLCSREQLWNFAFDDANSERDFRAMRRRLQKRFKYYEKKQKLEEAKWKKSGAKSAREEQQRDDETKNAFASLSSNSCHPSSSSAAVVAQSPTRPSPPSSSGYSTTTTASSAAEGRDSPALGGRQVARGTARRPNAGTKRQRYSPGAEALNPQQEVRRGAKANKQSE